MCWLARPAAGVPDGDDWLTPHERAYADRQRFTKRRSEFRMARYAAKSALARVLDLPDDAAALARIEIRHEPSGAPFACVDGRRADWQISLTDRADWAVCLLARGAGRIGCDLELVEPRSAAFVADFFTAAEQSVVAAAAERDLAANLIWSAKESALKVLTTGLRRDTRSVEVSATPTGSGWRPLQITAVEGDAYPGWWRRDGSFVLTIATATATDPPEALEPEPFGTAAPAHGWLGQPTREPGPTPS